MTASPACEREAGQSSPAAWLMPVSPGETTTIFRTWGFEPLDDLPRAARYLQRNPVGRQQALSQRPYPLRRGGHPAGREHRALLADRDLDEIKMHIQP